MTTGAESTGSTMREVGARLSNWGRWGEDDQRGTLNLLTPEHTASAAALVTRGHVVELSIPLGADGPQRGGGGRVNPQHLMSIMPDDLTLPDGLFIADDTVSMPLQAATQWDSLAHVGYDGLLYNGVPASSVTAIGGASRNAITAALPGFVGRGVLLDVARHRGVDWLAAGAAVEADELTHVATSQGVEVGAGDAVLVRTGWRHKAVTEGWSEEWISVNPGLALSCAAWLHARDVVAVAADNWGVEAVPSPVAGSALPLHGVLIRDMGMMLGEMFDLEELAIDCAATGRYEFLLVAPPLRVVGGVGSPAGPVAIA